MPRMIREPAAIWTHGIYRPLRRAGRRVSQQIAPRNTQHPSRRPERYLALDNARFLLIALVVVGHLLEQLVNAGPASDTLYRWIYLFHMPGFILISGALSRRTLTRKRVLGLATGLLLPYLIFQTLYPAWDAWLFQTGWSHDYLTPYWLLWYLPSLACWRLLMPLFAHRWALPLAVAIALAAGLAPWIGYPFSLSRTLVFFPLFLLGNRIGAQRLQRLGNAGLLRGSAVLVLAAAAFGAWMLRDMNPEWLYASVGYTELHASALAGSATRLALLIASAACALACITLMPRRPVWAAAGRRSLVTYLTHGFLVRGLVAAGVFAWLAQVVTPPLEVLLCVAAAALIASVLSTQVADRLAAPLTRPVNWVRRVIQLPPAPPIRRRMD